ncbi:MAG: nucleoside kinase, partial [Bacilli bacterium]|nr:nucleoside kinase [Bacilli bacterium]
ALDIKLLNEQMLQLIEGDEVVLPHFDFKLGKRVSGRKLKVEKNQPIIIEGIHALNDDLTSLISKSQKFKIFIAPQAQINIDNHNPISLTDLRLLRRIVRDSKFRHASAEETIRMWPSVRNGEFKWIYKTQESADYVFNSFLPYELCVMKEYAYPLLAKVDKNSDCYITCRRLLLFLKYLVNIEEDDVPDNSLMREFIGGSCFKDV